MTQKYTLETALGIKDFTFGNLYQDKELSRLDAEFMTWLKKADETLAESLQAARQKETLIPLEESSLILALAPYVEEFIAALFQVEKEVTDLQNHYKSFSPLYPIKKNFVQKSARKIKADAAEAIDGTALHTKLSTLFKADFSDLTYATHVENWLTDKEANTENLAIAAEYAAWALHTTAGKTFHKNSAIFKAVQKIDPDNLVPLKEEKKGEVTQFVTPHTPRYRDGFKLTDKGMSRAEISSVTQSCALCHPTPGKDSCSKGLKDKKTGDFKSSAFGETLAGCPLEEKISEFQTLTQQTYMIGALATITIDNPMAAATGHRICNECIKSCLFQKQDAVNTPEVETRVLKDVLALPWGFEIYSLLTRWNPLNIARPLPRDETGKNVLIVGQGPAGFTLAHHLLNEGHNIVAIDGAKIEPLPAHLSGIEADGTAAEFTPIQNIEDLYEELDERITAGFGGVIEYGITVRWNKNYLKLVRLLLERRKNFALFSGVRFGGTITIEDAFDRFHFDHVALCAGAGAPTLIDMKNGLARGVRQASDFLMSLQLTGAAKENSLANLQLRLPVVVIGGGLTAIDTATEALAYYPVQVEKFLKRYEILTTEKDIESVRTLWTTEETEIADEFIAHAQALRTEKEAAQKENRTPDTLSLLKEWGGSTVIYRRRIVDAPAYTLNPEEIEKALEEGIGFVELCSPTEVILDDYGHAEKLKINHKEDGEKTVPARSILIAAGTKPNTVIAEESPAHFTMNGKFFQALNLDGNPVDPERFAKPKEVHILASKYDESRAISFLGDLHPSFAGNVVKAMASAKNAYPIISKILEKPSNKATQDFPALKEILNQKLRAKVAWVKRLTDNIIEVAVHAPLAAERFQPGQFYRLQNFESLAPTIDGTKLAMEGIALTGAWVDVEKGILAMIVLEMGGSSSLCTKLKPEEPVIVMGPTGEPTEITTGETVALIGGGLGNAVLFSIGAALRAKGSKTLYFAGYKKPSDRYYVDKIEKAADVIIWCCDEEDKDFTPARPQDKIFTGNIVEAMTAHATGNLGKTEIPFTDIDRMIVIGSDRMMAAVKTARNGSLKQYLPKNPEAIASINSPMQCMMKKICAQCLQPHTNPETDEVEIVFSCANQDQDLNLVDFDALNQRLGQNTVHEKLTKQWIARFL
ncbi:MAG: FAD-dependent oxidoreductase [Alphaproteobacteria bacterium]